MNMATKTANVLARVEPDVKQQAEEIMSQLGIPVSVVINMLYKQIIMKKVGEFLKEFFIDGLTGMAQGLFATLIIGTIVTQIASMLMQVTFIPTELSNFLFVMKPFFLSSSFNTIS